jgi:hypothetical protein
MVASPGWGLPIGGILPLAVNPRLWDPRLLWGTLVLAAAITLGALVIAALKCWREQPPTQEPSANEQLAYFRELYDQGELSGNEFARIKARLAERLRQELDLPAPLLEEEKPLDPAKPPEQKEPPDSFRPVDPTP